MTLIKKADVLAYRAARRSSGLRLVSSPDKASEIQSPKNKPPAEASATTFADDFALDHSAPGGTVSAKVFPGPVGAFRAAKTCDTEHS
jgi:hypothetical protein